MVKKDAKMQMCGISWLCLETSIYKNGVSSSHPKSRYLQWSLSVKKKATRQRQGGSLRGIKRLGWSTLR